MTQRGFTLVETLVAVSILTLAVSGPLFTASRVLNAAEMARDQLTASYLAQEGVEYIREVRDDAFLNVNNNGGTGADAWTTFLNTTSICNAPGVCSLDSPQNVSPLSQCSSNNNVDETCTSLYLANGLYTQQNISGTETPFVRTIRLSNTSSGVEDEQTVVSTVQWTFHNTLYEVSVVDHLTPWQ